MTMQTYVMYLLQKVLFLLSLLDLHLETDEYITQAIDSSSDVLAHQEELHCCHKAQTMLIHQQLWYDQDHGRKKYVLGITIYFLGMVSFISCILISNFPIKASTC
jgi:hypothetical protein